MDNFLAGNSLNDRQTIGIDIDEVLAHFLEAYISFYNEKHGTSFKRGDFFSYKFWEVMGGDMQKAIGDVHEFFETSYFREMLPVEGSQRAVEELGKSYDLSIITSRQTILEEETKKWLENNFNGIFSGVNFGNHYGLKGVTKSKPEICKELGVGLLIEDSIEYALECAKNDINVILLDSPWNRNELELPNNVARVHSWEEIVQIIN